MSWFDAAGIAGLAKSAFKEAQKTFDKALELTDDHGDDTSSGSTSVENELPENKPKSSGAPYSLLGTLGSTLFQANSSDKVENEIGSVCNKTAVDSTNSENCPESADVLQLSDCESGSQCVSLTANTGVDRGKSADAGDASSAHEVDSSPDNIVTEGMSKPHESIYAGDNASVLTSSDIPPRLAAGVRDRTKTVSDSEACLTADTNIASFGSDASSGMTISSRSRTVSELGGDSTNLISGRVSSQLSIEGSMTCAVESLESLASSNSSCQTLVSVEHVSGSAPVAPSDYSLSEGRRISDCLSDGTGSVENTSREQQHRPQSQGDFSVGEIEINLEPSNTGDSTSDYSVHAPIPDTVEMPSNNDADGVPLAAEDCACAALEVDTRLHTEAAADDCYSPSTMASSVEVLDRGPSPSDDLDNQLAISVDSHRQSLVPSQLGHLRQLGERSSGLDSVEAATVESAVDPSKHSTESSTDRPDCSPFVEESSTCDMTTSLPDMMLNVCVDRDDHVADFPASHDHYDAECSHRPHSADHHETGSNSPDSEIPISSSGTSIDGVVVGGGGTAGTETTASSDVEVLVSPSGEARYSADCPPHQSCCSSQRHSTAGPLMTASQVAADRGHSRQLSQTSTASCDSDLAAAVVVGQTARRVRHLEETLAAREAKLVELSQRNARLHEENSNLSSQVELLETCAGSAGRAAVERDRLLGQLNEKQRECSRDHVLAAEVREELAEKDTLIAELRLEGEKLSKDQLRYNTAIKKLRARDQQRETEHKKTSDKLTSCSAELDSLRHQLSDSVDSVRQRDAEVAQLTREVEQLRRQTTDADSAHCQAQHRAEELEQQLERLSCRLAEQTERAVGAEAAAVSAGEAAALETERAVAAAVEEARRGVVVECDELRCQLDTVRAGARQSQRHLGDTELALREHVAALEARLAEAVRGSEDMPAAVAAATAPLQRQLDTTRVEQRRHSEQWRRQVEAVDARCRHLDEQVQRLTDSETRLTEQCEVARVARREVDERAAGLTRQLAVCQRRADNAEAIVTQLRQSAASNEAERTRLTAECGRWRERAEAAVAAAVVDKQRATCLQQQLETATVAPSVGMDSCVSDASTPRTSPTPSLSRMSFSSSTTTTPAPLAAGAATRSVSMTTSTPVPGAAVLETLTAQLQRRDGELRQLRTERRQLVEQLHQLSEQLQLAESQSQQLPNVSGQLVRLQNSYDQLLQMHGELVELNDELKMDLADVKLAYRQQIDVLTATSSASHSDGQ